MKSDRHLPTIRILHSGDSSTWGIPRKPTKHMLSGSNYTFCRRSAPNPRLLHNGDLDWKIPRKIRLTPLSTSKTWKKIVLLEKGPSLASCFCFWPMRQMHSSSPHVHQPGVPIPSFPLSLLLERSYGNGNKK